MSDLCRELHKIVRGVKRFSVDSGYGDIPKNGIYIMFERDEAGHGGERIVRIGTHTGEGQLPSRIFQHFENENKNRSIFRKNIGRCLLSKDNSEYLSIWEMDTTSRAGKERFLKFVNKEFEKNIEKRISDYIQNNLTFCLLDVLSKEDRLYFESRLIGTVSCCEECHASKNWLGNLSPVKKIKESGLWQVMGLYSEPLSIPELQFIKTALVV